MSFLAAIPAWVGPAIGLAGIGLSAVSMIGSAQSQRAGAEFQAKQAGYNAQVASQQAEAARTAGEMKSNQLRQEQRRFAGSVKAGYGASGVTMAGTPLEVMNENTRLMEQDLLNLRYNTEVAAQTAENKANQYNAAAGFYGSMSPILGAAGYVGAGSAILGGAYRFLGPDRPNFGPDRSGATDSYYW